MVSLAVGEYADDRAGPEVSPAIGRLLCLPTTRD
jgi:hypothetical protein